jgi:ATP:corrinoid adenosyltransferase
VLLSDREQVIENVIEKCKKVLFAKGKDYSGEEDSLSNFKRNGDRIGLTKYQVWSCYANKHIDSINNSIKLNPIFPQVESEPLESRIIDVVNYMLILAALLEEDKQAQLVKDQIKV